MRFRKSPMEFSWKIFCGKVLTTVRAKQLYCKVLFLYGVLSYATSVTDITSIQTASRLAKCLCNLFKYNVRWCTIHMTSVVSKNKQAIFLKQYCRTFSLNLTVPYRLSLGYWMPFCLYNTKSNQISKFLFELCPRVQNILLNNYDYNYQYNTIIFHCVN